MKPMADLRWLPSRFIATALLAALIALSGCTAASPDYNIDEHVACCQTLPPLAGAEYSISAPTMGPSTSALPVTPLPLRIYDLRTYWTQEVRAATPHYHLTGLPTTQTRLDGFTEDSVVAGRCRISGDRFGGVIDFFQFELEVGEAILVPTGVLICDGVQAEETIVALADAQVLSGATWSYRGAAPIGPWPPVRSQTSFLADRERVPAVPLIDNSLPEIAIDVRSQGALDLVGDGSGGDLIVEVLEPVLDKPEQSVRIWLPGPDQPMLYGDASLGANQGIWVPGGILVLRTFSELVPTFQLVPYDLIPDK